MPIEKTVELQVDVKEALKKLGDLDDRMKDVEKNTKKTGSAVGGLAKNFKAFGIAKITVGVQLLSKFFNTLWEQMQKNQQVTDLLNTAMNSIGVVFKLVTDAITNTYNAIAKSSDNFDALGKVAVNLLNIAITPLKLAFQSIKLGIQKAMLAWEESFLGGKGKDKERIAELRAEIDSTKESIKNTANSAWESAKAVRENVGEAISEVINIGETATAEFEKVFKDVTISSIIEQGKAITETKKNYELLALQQQRLVEQYDIDAESQRAIRDDVSRSIEDRIAANDRLGEVLKEQNKAEQEAVDAQIAALRERIALEGENVELSNEIFALETEKVAIQAKVKGFEAEQLTNINSLLQEQKDLDDELIAQQYEKVAVVTGAMGQISQALGENTKAGKGLAIAQALIDTYAGATKALAQGGIFGTISAVGIIAAGLGNVAKIRATSVDGGDPGGSTPDVPNVSEPSGMSLNAPNIESILGGGGGSVDAPPVQAYVVENDISNAQALQEELETQATL